VVAERREGPLAHERQRAGAEQSLVLLGEGGDFLSHALLAAPDQADMGRDPLHDEAGVGLQALELVGLDHQRQLGEPRPQ
jgi:hypothetical protein